VINIDQMEALGRDLRAHGRGVVLYPSRAPEVESAVIRAAALHAKHEDLPLLVIAKKHEHALLRQYLIGLNLADAPEPVFRTPEILLSHKVTLPEEYVLFFNWHVLTKDRHAQSRKKIMFLLKATDWSFMVANPLSLDPYQTPWLSYRRMSERAQRALPPLFALTRLSSEWPVHTSPLARFCMDWDEFMARRDDAITAIQLENTERARRFRHRRG